MSKRWPGIVFVAFATVFSLAVYSQLPDRIATHFNRAGQPDGYSSRAIAAFTMPLLMIVTSAFVNLLPRMLPRRRNFAAFQDTYGLITSLLIAYMAVVHVVLLGRALGWPINIPTAVLLAVGSLFTILGTLLPRVKSNWIMGIRTPWTLDSENVWRETHRLGGRTFVAGGLITMAAAFLPARLQPLVGMGGLLIGAFIPVIYSYVIWRREQREPSERGVQ